MWKQVKQIRCMNKDAYQQTFNSEKKKICSKIKECNKDTAQ